MTWIKVYYTLYQHERDVVIQIVVASIARLVPLQYKKPICRNDIVNNKKSLGGASSFSQQLSHFAKKTQESLPLP